MKRILTLVIILALTFAMTAMAEMPDYLNTESEFPIVKEGEEITLTIAVMPNVLDNVEELWFWEYCREVMNINFEITAFTSDVRDEKINLMFASDSLPDIIIGCSFSVSELVEYGQMEGQLLALNQYLDDYAPNVKAVFDENPQYKGIVTALDGNVYSLPCINPSLNELGIMPGMFVNTTVLEQADLSMPATLDEFYQMLVKFKELYPDSIPLGGGINASEPVQMIWSALGVTADTATKPGFADGEVTVLCGDEIRYTEYLAFMNKLYAEGLIDPDYYTIDNTQLNGELAEGKVFVAATPVYNALPNSWSEWAAMPPLTSDVNETLVWQSSSLAKPGAAVVSSKTEYPELCVRFLDFFFTAKGGIYAWDGPLVGSEDCLELSCGWHDNELFPLVEDGTYPSAWEYVVYNISPFNPNRVGTKAGEVERLQFQDPNAVFAWDLTNPDNFYRASKQTAEYPYLVDNYPTIYFDGDTQQRISELQLVIEDFVANESAKFITGINSLDNIDAYYKQLDALGYEEYLGYYVSAYETYLTNLE